MNRVICLEVLYLGKEFRWVDIRVRDIIYILLIYERKINIIY